MYSLSFLYPHQQRTPLSLHQVSFEADKVKPAMEFFKLAGRYNHAIRLGFEKNLDYDVVQYALESPNKRHTMLAARKFEAKNSLEHAVRLYQDCGEIKRALELCFKAVPPMFDRYGCGATWVSGQVRRCVGE